MISGRKNTPNVARAFLGYNVDMVRVEHVLDTWRSVRDDTAAAVEEFPAEEFDFQPTADVSTFRQIARHTLDAGDALAGALLAGVEDFHLPETRAGFKQYFRPLAQDCPAAELVAALRESVSERACAVGISTGEFF
jgi:hypothetical protein